MEVRRREDPKESHALRVEQMRDLVGLLEERDADASGRDRAQHFARSMPTSPG